MLNNQRVKEFLSRLMGGSYAEYSKTIPFYPTIDIRKATVVTKTADYSITESDLLKPTIFNNAGDDGTQVLSLPKASRSRGCVVRAHALATQAIRFLPQTGEAVNYNGSAVVTKYLNIAGVIGNYVELFCDGYQWVVTQANGAVTKEA